jgi:hypothetical protein
MDKEEKPITFTYMNPKTEQAIIINDEKWIYECKRVEHVHGTSGFDVYVPRRFKHKRLLIINIDDCNETLIKKLKYLLDKIHGKKRFF